MVVTIGTAQRFDQLAVRHNSESEHHKECNEEANEILVCSLYHYHLYSYIDL